MNKFPLYFLAVAVVLLITVGALFYSRQGRKSANPDQQVKSAHFVDSTPLHDDIYAAPPINVTINFNFDLAGGSKISVTQQYNADGDYLIRYVEWTEGETLIEDNNTALKKKLKQGMPDGNYLVKYTACWPDGSCHDGQFSFKIDSSKKSEYQDLRGQKEVTIKMKDIRFDQTKILISPSTKVTWVNEDDVGHFVNTETHPEHTYFPDHNSREISNGQSFSTTFQTTGQYNYHCSAHVPQGMIASLIISN